MKKKNLVYLGFGSNLGEKEQVILQAYELLKQALGPLKKQSSFFYSEAFGFESENTFVNSVCLFETEKNANEILMCTKEVELQMGRTQKSIHKQYQDRILDIDILLFNEEIIDTPDLQVPHPELQNRDFVYVPLLEIEPFIKHPTFNRSLSELIAK